MPDLADVQRLLEHVVGYLDQAKPLERDELVGLEDLLSSFQATVRAKLGMNIADHPISSGTFRDIEALIERVMAAGARGVVLGKITDRCSLFTITRGDLRGLGSIVAEAIRESNQKQGKVTR